MPSCSHKHLRFASIEWEDGYKQPGSEVIQQALRVDSVPKNAKRAGGTTAEQRIPTISSFQSHTFPAPLVECEDELYHDPDYAPQDAQEWFGAKYRNAVTSRRRTIYVVQPPVIAGEVASMRSWATPQKATVPKKRKATAGRDGETVANDTAVTTPEIGDVAEYLRAFYHGLPVKVLDEKLLRFVSWDEHSQQRGKQQKVDRIGLQTRRETVGVSYRASPDGIFRGQLNLNDVMDVALSILPSDAYALLMLVHQDLYEDEHDDFCCGRAFGGSRVAVVSSARYHPELDSKQHVVREHAWPASHCRKASEEADSCDNKPRKNQKGTSQLYPDSAIAAGVEAFNALPSPTTIDEYRNLWLGRVCKTASHELGHCFGIDHCTYFACIMQGTANLAEDSRQPPYLCPVDLVKVLTATGSSEREHFTALLAFCEQYPGDRMFAAFAPWARTRLRQVRVDPGSR